MAGKGDKDRLKGKEIEKYKNSPLWDNIKKKKNKDKNK